jgi:hypothetical protein
MRRERDFYETAPWQVRALLAHQPISGVVLEPCVGDWSIANELREVPGVTVATNDIDPERTATFHVDASHEALYRQLDIHCGGCDWVITNPPYAMPMCTNIVQQAVKHARVGVAMMLRISFREPTAKVNPRGPFLEQHPISRLLTLPRYSFTGNGKSDSATTEWAIWLKPDAPGRDLPAILSLYNADKRYALRAEKVA